ncbi:unnamed protein product [Rhodiola kirilowii]
MQEDETIADFNTRVLDISNEAFALGEPMTEETLVRKVLRSLTKWFAMKALAVKEANNVKTMRLDELMGSLQTHEMDMNEEDRLTKISSVGLKGEVVKNKIDDASEQQFAMFAKNFGKFIRRQYGKGTESSQSSDSRFQKNNRTKFQKEEKKITRKIVLKTPYPRTRAKGSNAENVKALVISGQNVLTHRRKRMHML